jgi:hypothetical protein
MKNKKIVSELERSTLMKEVSWRQKSRVFWLWRVTSTRSFFTNWLTPTEGRVPLTPCIFDGTISTNRLEIGDHIV